MAKAQPLESALAELRVLKQRPSSEITDAEISALLASKHNIIAAAGAEIIADTRRPSHTKPLLAAFDRFMKNSGQSDKGCLAKVAIVHALTALDERATDIFLQGVHHIQKEAGWGGSVDTAGELRGRCIVALAESGHPDALLEIASLLVDPDGQARVGAVRACTAVASVDAPALLRLKLLTGDEEPIVLGEACAALLHLDAEKHADFLRQFLDKPDSPIAQAAISSLAESRDPAAFHMLKKMHQQALTAHQRAAALQALALLRVDGAPEFLLDLVEHDLHPRAREVITALYPRRDDEPFRRRLDAALERRDDKLLQKFAADIFASNTPPRSDPSAVRK